MPESDRYRLRRILPAILIAASVAASPASAQNLLDSILGAFGARPAQASASGSERADPGAWDFIDKHPAAASGGTSYCVRLCDGRYFPLPRRAGAVNMSNAQICSAMCPAADTRVFKGGAIERAMSEDGKPYSSIKTAFLYREKTVDRCTCRHGGADGVASLDAMSDPTLRRGDIVVTRDGPMVFTGAERSQKREQAFVPAEEYKGLPQSVRRELAVMQVAKDASETASLPTGAAPTAISYVPSRARLSPVEITPVAEAFASFAN